MLNVFFLTRGKIANKIAPGKYWVSAVSMGCPSVLRWCDRITNPIFDSADLPWKTGEPSTDPLKECTVVDYQLKPPHFTFSKSSCIANYLALYEDY
jgi:hypothetical protein